MSQDLFISLHGWRTRVGSRLVYAISGVGRTKSQEAMHAAYLIAEMQQRREKKKKKYLLSTRKPSLFFLRPHREIRLVWAKVAARIATFCSASEDLSVHHHVT